MSNASRNEFMFDWSEVCVTVLCANCVFCSTFFPLRMLIVEALKRLRFNTVECDFVLFFRSVVVDRQPNRFLIFGMHENLDVR